MFFIITGLILAGPGIGAGRTLEDADQDVDRAFTVLKEAYQARDEGNEELAREKMARALALFRRSAAGSAPGLVKPETEYILEETPRNINLIENKTLLKIEFKVDPAARNRIDKDQKELIRQQQLILQQLIQLSRENTELKKLVSQVESNTKETDSIHDIVTDIRDETDGISDLDNRLDDIKDVSDDIYDTVDKLDDGSETVDKIEDVSDDVSDIRDDMDMMKDILNIVEDIKSDTDDIKDLEDKIEEVKDSVEDTKE